MLDAARADYQSAIANLRSARAQVTASQAQLSSAQTNLSIAQIVSPVTGVVLSRVNIRQHARYGYGDSMYYYRGYKKYYSE